MLEDKLEIISMQLKASIVKGSKDTNISSLDDVPIADKTAYATLLPDEKYEFISRMKFGEDFPAQLDPWTKVILTSEWATSFAKAVNNIPKPVFVPGHMDQDTYKTRAIPDGYMTGAKVINEILYLRNSLPTGETDERKAFMGQAKREIAAGMLSTSIGDVSQFKRVFSDEFGKDDQLFAIESLKAQTNALVEVDQTGSEADIVLTSFKSSGVEGDESMEPKTFDLEQVYVALSNQLESGKLAVKDLAKKLGITVMTTKQAEALKRLNDAESKVGDITEFVAKQAQNKQVTFDELCTSALKSTFKTDELIEVATTLFTLKEGSVDEIKTEIERVAALKMFTKHQGVIAASINTEPATVDADNKNNADSSSAMMEG